MPVNLYKNNRYKIGTKSEKNHWLYKIVIRPILKYVTEATRRRTPIDKGYNILQPVKIMNCLTSARDYTNVDLRHIQ